MVTQRLAAHWLIFGLLLGLSFVSTAGSLSRAQEAPSFETAVLVSRAIDLDAPEGSSLSASTFVMFNGQATLPLAVRGTVLVLVEIGRARIETDQTLAGAVGRDVDTSGSTTIYDLGIGERVLLPPGAVVQFRNDEPDPVRLFVLSVLPEGE